jgi:two-component system response regulator HydG
MAALHSEGALQTADLPSALQYQRASSELQSLSGVFANLDGQLGGLPHFDVAPRSPVISIPQSEKQAIANALAATGGERGKAARLLGIGRTTLYRKVKEYGL